MRKYNINVKAALAVFAIVLSACSSDNDIVDNNSNNQEKTVSNKIMSFRASMDGTTTRTDFNGNRTIWSDNDAISIMNTASVPEETDRPTQAVFTISEGAGTKEATFTGGPIRANGNNADNFYAFYPATTLSTSNNTIKASASVPTVQTAINGSYDQSLHFMSAYSTNSTFNFKNVCALLKITLTGNDETEDNNTNPVCRVKVVANPTLSAMNAQEFTYTNIAGSFTATIDNNGIATTTTATGAKNTYVELRAAGDNGTAKTSLGNGTFYMVVLPAQLNNGFTLLLEKKDGTIYQRINAKKMAFERNKMYNLQSYDCSGTISGMTELTNVVDLDLPSGTIWCKKNVKTTRTGYVTNYKYTFSFVDNETDYGDYFSWGKTHFTGATTYGSIPDCSQTDRTLPNQYDPAYSISNNQYCMPIFAQMYEFYNHFPDANKESHITYRTWGLSRPATDGYAKFTAPTGTGRTIYLPYGGHYYSTITSLIDLGSPSHEFEQGDYWSRTIYGWQTLSEGAYCMDIKEANNLPVLNEHPGADFARPYLDNVICGRTIRPVVTNIQIAPIY